MNQVLVDTPPMLTPIIHPWIEAFFHDHLLHEQLANNYGSPLNLHNMTPFVENYQAYCKEIESHDLAYQIFFARKSNKFTSFVKTAQIEGFGIDTASFQELNQCLNIGVDPKRLVFTGSIKTKETITLAIKKNILIILDNFDEIDAVKTIAANLDMDVRVGLRVSGFTHNNQKLYSRFGFDIDSALSVLLERLCICDHIRFEGFHFHLDGYSVEQRVSAFDQIISLTDQMAALGISTGFIDMGGGLLINYLKDRDQWETFDHELQLAVEGVRPPLTFRNNGLGYAWRDDQVEGKLETYPYFNECAKEHFLRSVLLAETSHGTVAHALRERNIELRLEPGRSLLDQTGITLAKVVYRKYDSNKDLIVGLEMNKTQLCCNCADFLLDPFLIPMITGSLEEEPSSAYLVGAYGLEQDLILKRKVVLPQIPQVGDMICFVNTAGYMMHFYESQSHHLGLAENLIISEDHLGLGQFCIRAEDKI